MKWRRFHVWAIVLILLCALVALLGCQGAAGPGQGGNISEPTQAATMTIRIETATATITPTVTATATAKPAASATIVVIQKTATIAPIGTVPIQNCDPAYPDFCIAPPPPDLNCPDVLPHHNFKVLPPDPHGFDKDGNGIGCEN